MSTGLAQLAPGTGATPTTGVSQSSDSSDAHDESNTATLINGTFHSRSHSHSRSRSRSRSRNGDPKAKSKNRQSWFGRLLGLEHIDHHEHGSEREPLLANGDGIGNGDEEEGGRKGRVWTFGSRDWRTWVTFGLLVALGILLGVLSTKGVQKWEESRDPGPLVPPVYSLPPPTGEPRNPAYLSPAAHGAVASEDITCSNLGLSILREHNGTAVDAAITTTLCIGLLNAFSSGIGGGGFMVIRKPTVSGGWQASEGGEMTAIDFRETSPKRSDKWMFGDKKAGRMAAQVGGMSVGTPGELRGLEAAHKLYGTLPWKDLVMPVAKLARQYQVSRELARRLRIFGHYMLDSPAWSESYAPKGYLAVEGEWIKREKYGKTLETIAERGADAFYEGDMAQKMVRTIHKAGGVLQLDDFTGYKARVYPAIHHKWGDKDVYTTAAPSSGGVLIGLLNILHPLGIPQTGGFTNTLNVHRFIEALKFAFGARSWVTDPAYAQLGNKERMEEVITDQWAEGVRARIDDDKTHNSSYYGIQFDTPKDAGTTHLAVVDRWGGVASVTSTINYIWGSHVMCPDTGVIMNDELADFSVPGAPDAFGLWPSPWNYPAPGKKPLSSTSPIIILQNSTFWGTFGGSGGSRIFGSVAQVLLNLEAGMNLSAAIDAPRWHNQVSPNVTTLEVGPEGAPRELIKGLEERGQVVGLFDINLGAAEVQGIVAQNGTLWASSDSRKNGIAAGY